MNRFSPVDHTDQAIAKIKLISIEQNINGSVNIDYDDIKYNLVCMFKYQHMLKEIQNLLSKQFEIIEDHNIDSYSVPSLEAFFTAIELKGKN